ncbi:hypothetical protein Acid345_1155 [Candidatus Koribacter versatilis Ellin345]|uniref:Transmembrane protein n=1 Tax=Koribacter versatilis (strain Ellin345) TaxID=204669 RepID=Q1ISJ2_KORVE|nr:hypothetical protein [Candidatus Koribacter versatilis]ABF40158.1 hypothetical protein Acid345_1155 [Candidatus Koribacter versatilis Ellin345]
MNRPTGVTVLAILLFIGTAFCALIAVACFVGGAFIGSFIGAAAKQSGAGAAGAGIGAAIGAVVGVVFIFIGALNAVCGFGLWGLKEWGRMLTIILTGIGLVFAVLGLFVSMLHFNLITMFLTLVRMGIAVLVIWYLMQPHVKAAFAPPQAYAAR